MLKATILVAGSLLVSASTVALADAPQQFAQAQTQSKSQMEMDFQRRMDAAKTPEEKARVQADHDKMMRDGGAAVRTAPGTAGSGTMPDRPGQEPQAGQTPGGGANPPGQ